MLSITREKSCPTIALLLSYSKIETIPWYFEEFLSHLHEDCSKKIHRFKTTLKRNNNAIRRTFVRSNS